MMDVLQGMDGIAPADIAERWFARLMSPDCTLREREQFEAWLGQSPENALAFEETKALWAGLEGLEDDEVIGPQAAAALLPDTDSFMSEWVAAAHGKPRRPTHGRPRRWLPIGAGIAATLAVAVFLRVFHAPEIPVVPYATSDKIESVQLPDGSSIQLDLETAVAVRIGEGRRDVEMQQGRAMFNVARDADRPFVVSAGAGTVTVFGTQFEVQRQGEVVAVTLLEGAVGIATASGKADARSLRLVPGQRATYAPATSSWSVETADAAALTSWSQGFHVFGATPLRDALAEINRYSDVKLALADPALGVLAVSGSYKLGDGRAVSEALPFALPVKAEERDGNIVISKR